MVEQHMVGESDKVPGLNQNAGLQDIVERVVPDIDLGHCQTAALHHGVDRRRCREFERLRR